MHARMTKRCFDIMAAGLLLIFVLPLILLVALAVFAQDRQWPFYVATRVGLNGRPFRMYKIRSMIQGADSVECDIVGAGDRRVTPLGWRIRRYKLDELPQLCNILLGQMSMVGPRPNTPRHVEMLDEQERELLKVKPGLTDLSSVAFFQQASLFGDSHDTEADYLVRMRPLKTALGVWYTRHGNSFSDVAVLLITALSFLHYHASIKAIDWLLAAHAAPMPLRTAVQDLRLGKWHTKSLEEFGLCALPPVNVVHPQTPAHHSEPAPADQKMSQSA
jgi:lipopolysaccharide/colanic/teichoic acid biosynthesis glycosyltransferase